MFEVMNITHSLLLIVSIIVGAWLSCSMEGHTLDSSTFRTTQVTVWDKLLKIALRILGMLAITTLVFLLLNVFVEVVFHIPPSLAS